MKYDAVIFDLDGVICSTDHLHYMAWKQLADEYHIYFDEKINDRLRGVSRMESLAIILERYEGDKSGLDREAMAGEKNGIYQRLLQTISPDDVPSETLETLNRIKGKGYKIAIGSSSKNTSLILKQVGLECFFDAVSDGNNITKAKPDPEVFLKAAEFLKVRPEKCIVVEDASAGIRAGISAGMATIAIGGAVNSRLADYNVDHFREINHLL